MIPQWAYAYLLLERRDDTISKLFEVENNTPGFSVIIIKNEGFSNNNEVHNLVVDYFKKKNVELISISAETKKLMSSFEQKHSPFEIHGEDAYRIIPEDNVVDDFVEELKNVG
jgi:hypothetical protein